MIKRVKFWCLFVFLHCMCNLLCK